MRRDWPGVFLVVFVLVWAAWMVVIIIHGHPGHYP